ncbi:MAG: hypothetical protein JW790_00050 [Dehalococcoidales bacterium]|nr:hypothetical protein [Dehalococcoidales bacterium]
MPPEGGPPTGDQPPAPELDLAAAAAKLGVTEEQLSEALGDQWPLDLTAAAVELGVSEESLREALGIPEGSAFPGGGSPTPELDLETAAAELGVTEEQLSEALGDQWPLDLAAAAEELGVSEESLREALGISEGPAFPGGGGHPPGGGGPADAKEGI